MDRRCNTMGHCQIGTATKRFAFLDMPIANVMANPQRDWGLIVADVNKNSRVAKHHMSVDWSKYNSNYYVFNHCSIVASVETEANNYRIIDPCDELVNANGNAWTNEVLPHCFRTFVGGENYYEHIQIPELSKGKILDAVLRPVTYIGKNNKKASVYYVDILVATARKHENIVSRVASGELTTLSMGAIANKCQCSYCGTITDDYTENCSHLNTKIGQYIIDKGKRYIVSELCGVIDGSGNYVQDSCHFIEASWVEQPAFKGAVVNYMINNPIIDDKVKEVIDNRDLTSLFSGGDDILAQLKVADIWSMMAIRVAMRECRKDRYNGIINNIINGV